MTNCETIFATYILDKELISLRDNELFLREQKPIEKIGERPEQMIHKKNLKLSLERIKRCSIS